MKTQQKGDGGIVLVLPVSMKKSKHYEMLGGFAVTGGYTRRPVFGIRSLFPGQPTDTALQVALQVVPGPRSYDCIHLIKYNLICF